MSKIIAVVSGKGGVGKTMLAVNMAAALALKGNKTVIIDLDFGMRGVDIALGLENNVIYDIVDILEGTCRIKQALIKDKRFDALYMIAPPQTKADYPINAAHISALCQKLQDNFEYIILDAPAGIGNIVKDAAKTADLTVIVSTPEPAAIRDASSINKTLEKAGVQQRKMVINKVRMNLIDKGFLPELEDIFEVFPIEICGMIPDDDNIYLATNNGIPIVLKQGSFVEKNISKIIDRILL